jgi:spore photoproduct lyase
MIPYCPEHVIVQEESWQDDATGEILHRLPQADVRTVRDPDIRSFSRNTLVLMRCPGRFLRHCQGSGAEICCNYYVVSYAWNCHLDCSYCVLQSYLNHEALLVCTNIEALLNEVKETLLRSPGRMFRIGTGELADSLAMDPITHYSRRIVPLFASLPNGVLELKTKSDQISNLRDLDHGGRTVVSWSMNSRRICLSEERNASTVEERLAAAAQCGRWGYRLGFHFDPLVYYRDWEAEYREVVKDLFHAVDAGAIAWISLGALRFTPHLREMVQRRFPESGLPYGEFVPGHHGKLRYFRPIREELYQKMISWIREEAPRVPIYLCMESRLVWERSFGKGEYGATHLCRQLDSAVPFKNHGLQLSVDEKQAEINHGYLHY